MKKNKYQKALRRSIANSKSSLKSRRRRKEIIKKRNRSRLRSNQVSQRLRGIQKRFASITKAIVPKDFSFLTNPKEVIAFITKLKSLFAQRREVFIEMENVRLIDYSAIIVLLSIMVKFKTENIRFNGDFPRDPTVNKIFMASGFFQILNINLLKNRDKFDFGNPNFIHTHASKRVDPELGPEIMNNISKILLGEKAVYKGLQRTLIELMQNSFNHAEPEKEGDKHWWLSVNVNADSSIVSFSFIDYGIGIFESLNSKGQGSKWFNWRGLLAKFSMKSNADVLKLILDGDLHRTVTGQDFRGKGLPGIKEAMDRNLISKLFVITNDVFADVNKNIYIPLPNNFEGTFVYWEIDYQTVSHPWNL